MRLRLAEVTFTPRNWPTPELSEVASPASIWAARQLAHFDWSGAASVRTLQLAEDRCGVHLVSRHCVIDF